MKNKIKRLLLYIKKNGIVKTLKRLCNGFKNKLFKLLKITIITEETKVYKNWIKFNEPNEKQLKKQKNYKFKLNPKISLLVPMYNTDEKYFRVLVNYLLNQTYSNWELCLADGSQTKIAYIEEIIKLDKRIKYVFIGENKGISGNTNEALKLATGDYIGLLDHDDLLPVFSLFEVVKTINVNPSVEFIYTDEDKFEGEPTNRFGPFFKPDFSLFTLRSANYICHFSLFKKELMDKLGGFRTKYDGSQDFDIVLRASELTDNIVHISKILYHWRVHKGSVSYNGSAKPYAYEIAKTVISDHLTRTGIDAEVVDGDILGSYKVKYKIKKNPLVSIIFDASNLDEKKVISTINQLSKTAYKNIEFIVIYNKDMLIDNVKFLKFAGKESERYNSAIKVSSGEYFIIIDYNFISINNNEWLENLLGVCLNNNIAVVGSKLYNKNKLIEHCAIILKNSNEGTYINKGIPKDSDVYMSRTKIVHNVSAVNIKYSFISREIYDKVGSFIISDNITLVSINFCMKCLKLSKYIILNPLVEFCISKFNEKEDENNIKKISKITDKYYNINLDEKNTNVAVKTFKVGG